MTAELESRLLSALDAIAKTMLEQQSPQFFSSLARLFSPNHLVNSPGFTKRFVFPHACRVCDIIAMNNHATDTIYIQVFNKAGDAQNRELPLLSMPVAPGTALPVPYFGGAPFDAGLSLAGSSTASELTLITGDNMKFTATLLW